MLKPIRITAWICVPFAVLLGCNSTPPPTLSKWKTLDEEIRYLISNIDFDNQSNDHGEQTPAAGRLRDIGDPVLPYLMPVLLDQNSHRRACAEWVLTEISMPWLGVERFKNDDAAFNRWRAFWKSLGSYHSDQPAVDRERSVQLWCDWLRKQGKLPANYPDPK